MTDKNRDGLGGEIRAALREWFGPRYRELMPELKRALVLDIYAMLRIGDGETPLQCVLLLDLRIHPATLHSYAVCLDSSDKRHNHD